MLGPDRKVVSIDKKVIVHEHEVIMVNGTPIVLEGEEGEAIKECLLRGSMPPQDLLNHLLLKAGLIVSGKCQTVKADMNVKTSVTTTENAALVTSFFYFYFEFSDFNVKGYFPAQKWSCFGPAYSPSEDI